jgi:hypothetical protein
MKRPPRPFVVEVKKKRGSPAKLRSIWGDLDLSTAAADPLPVSEGTLGPVGNDRDPDPIVEVDCTSSTSSIDTPSEEGDAHTIADASHAEPHPAEVKTEGAAEELLGRQVREGDDLGAQCTLFPGDQHPGGIKAGAVADGNETAAKCGLQPMALSVGEQRGGPRY